MTIELPTARITNEGVFFGEDFLPGVICEKGIKVIPGGQDGLNTLIVEFFVADVVVEDTDEVQFVPSPSAPNPYADLKCASLSPHTAWLGRPRLCERESHHEGSHRSESMSW